MVSSIESRLIPFYRTRPAEQSCGPGRRGITARLSAGAQQATVGRSVSAFWTPKKFFFRAGKNGRPAVTARRVRDPARDCPGPSKATLACGVDLAPLGRESSSPHRGPGRPRWGQVRNQVQRPGFVMEYSAHVEASLNLRAMPRRPAQAKSSPPSATPGRAARAEVHSSASTERQPTRSHAPPGNSEVGCGATASRHSIHDTSR